MLFNTFETVLIFKGPKIIHIATSQVENREKYESAKNERIDAHGLNRKIFVNSELIFGIYDNNYPMKKIFMSLRHFWNFRNIWNFANFWNFKWELWLNKNKYCQLYVVIFDENDVLCILVKFESDRMSPRGSAKNGQIGAHGLNGKIFVNSEYRFEVYDKNYPMKKISCLSDHFEIFVTQPGRSLHIQNSSEVA